MIKTYKFKLYKSKKNKCLNEQTKIAGNIYNHCISLKRKYYKIYKKSLSKFKLQKHLTKLKSKPKYSFWEKVNSQTIQDITDRIEKGYIAFFSNCKKQIKTRKVSPPSFKKVRTYSSITFKQSGYKILPLNQIKLGKRIYKYWKSREMKGEVKCVTVKKDKLGDWYIYFICQYENEPKLISKTGKTAGFDFGCTTFLTQNNGNEIKSPEFFKKNSKLIKKANRELSRKKQGSNNYSSSKIKLAKIYKMIVNKRNDFHFKLAKQLCEDFDLLIFETLNISEMKKTHGKKINDLGFSNFMNILKNKAIEYEKEIHCINKWFASTKTCSNCGYKNIELTQKDRKWLCPQCNKQHNRDLNAAINIFNKGIEEIRINKANSSNDFVLKDGTSSCWRESVSLVERQAALALA